MAKYRKKPVVIEASCWFSLANTPNLGVVAFANKVEEPCKHCGTSMTFHGWIKTLEGGHIVCPGDWIITGIKGEKYSCKPDIFAATYDAVPA